MTRLRTRLALFALLVGLSSCGEELVPEDPLAAAPDAGTEHLLHVHALKASGEQLLIGSHRGLWVARSGRLEPERVSDKNYDMESLLLQSPDRYLASGHPDSTGAALPPDLGLIESTDGGRNWKSVALLAEADLHLLTSSGSALYGVNSVDEAFMVSTDGGRSWRSRKPPAPIYSLAVSPDDPLTLIAATEGGLAITRSAGSRWTIVSDKTGGMLVWPAVGRLYMLRSDGEVLVSGDAGVSWEKAGDIEGQPDAFSADGERLFAAVREGPIKESRDGGKTWTVRARPWRG